MKKKINSNGIVTKRHLKKEIASLEVRLNKNLDKRFDMANKNLDKRFEIAERSLREEIRISFQEAEQRLEEKLSSATDTILTHIDPFVKEVRDSHEERAIVAHQISELRDRVDDHEERVKRLEH